jgi:hypothetical protein
LHDKENDVTKKTHIFEKMHVKNSGSHVHEETIETIGTVHLDEI